MSHSAVHGGTQTQTQSRGQSQQAARDHSTLRRRSVEGQNAWEDVLDEEIPDDLGGLPEDDRDPNDVFRDDSSVPLDFSWQKSDLAIEDYLLARPIRVYWRVFFEDEHTLAVEKLGPIKGDADRYRHAVLTVAANVQRAYLKSGLTKDLVVLTKDGLRERLKAYVSAREDDDDLGFIIEKKEGNEWISRYLRQQFFYAPKGGPHAFEFLLQADQFGEAEAHVFEELRRIFAAEKAAGQCLTDTEVGEKLGDALAGDPIGQRQISGLREREGAWFPNSTERKKRLCNHGR